MLLTLWYERKQPSPDELGAVLVSIVAIPSVTTEGAAVCIAVHRTPVSIGADDAAVPVVSVRGVGGGACSDAPSIHVGVIVSAAVEAAGLRSFTRRLHKAAATLQALAIVARLRWKRRDGVRSFLMINFSSSFCLSMGPEDDNSIKHRARSTLTAERGARERVRLYVRGRSNLQS
ncbi:hypothetical protein EYF80_016419 [Liparis tanakae]|uniref:Uncharacterized protein n=1 Tax=Liparis tanakae TaxID=230148 RepID=A0A4Z2I5D0_9TELE|nr:hypothetical protein EYF80_016419 [Liparis tanakae]